MNRTPATVRVPTLKRGISELHSTESGRTGIAECTLVLVNADDERVLASWRDAYVAKHAQDRVTQDHQFGTAHAEKLTFDEFKAFAQSVWKAEGRTEPLIVSWIPSLHQWTQDYLHTAGAFSKWSPQPWYPDVMTAYIDVKEEGLTRTTALHEIAHLLVDTEDVSLGHREEWAQAFDRLIQTHISVFVAVRWKVEFEWWTQKANEKIAADPMWLWPPPGYKQS